MADKALVVDDHPTGLELITVLLESEGFDVVTAQDAERALHLMDIQKPAVIVMDVQLPGMTGLEFVSRVRASKHRNICVVVVTSSAMESDREAALAIGSDGYFTKPINTRTFAGELRRVLKRRSGSLASPN